MGHKHEIASICADHFVSHAEKRRLNQLFEAIGRESKSTPSPIRQVRYGRADYDVATVRATREACSRISDAEKRQATRLAGLAHLYEQEQMLLDDYTQEAQCERTIVRAAQMADLREDLCEKEYDIAPDRFTLGAWIDETYRSIGAEKAKVAVLRPVLMTMLQPRDPRSA